MTRLDARTGPLAAPGPVATADGPGATPRHPAAE